MAQSTPTSALGWQDFFTTTLDGAITSTDTTISLASAPTPTEGFLVIEPDSSTNREIIMYTSVSGNDVICGSVDDRGVGGTTARAHSSGAIVKMNTVSDMFEALQSGNALTAGAIKPNALVSGTGTSWAWQTWAPSYSNITIGDGTVVAKYIQIGKTVTGQFTFTLGSTSAIGNSGTISTPVTASSNYTAQNNVIGPCIFLDSGTIAYSGIVRLETTTTFRPIVGKADTTYLGTAGITATIPHTWAVNDVISFSFTYEAT